MRAAAVAALINRLQGVRGSRQAWAGSVADQWRDSVFDRFEADAVDRLDRLDRQLLQALQELQGAYTSAEHFR